MIAAEYTTSTALILHTVTIIPLSCLHTGEHDVVHASETFPVNQNN